MGSVQRQAGGSPLPPWPPWTETRLRLEVGVVPGTSMSPTELEGEELLLVRQPLLGPGLPPFPACLTLARDSSPHRFPGRRDWLQPPSLQS